MSNLIDRQAAIDALDGKIEITGRTNAEAVKGYVRLVKDRLERLPSAQPEADEWCHDCKEYDPEKHCCPRWGQVIRTALEEAKPEHKIGKWIMGKCDQCGAHAPFWPMATTYYESDFCPNCGADIRGEQHG